MTDTVKRMRPSDMEYATGSVVELRGTYARPLRYTVLGESRHRTKHGVRQYRLALVKNPTLRTCISATDIKLARTRE